MTAYSHSQRKCDVLDKQGGPVVQQHATPELQAAMGIVKEPNPAGANGTGMRTTPIVFGLGLIDAVDDRYIISLSRIPHPEGVHGKPAILPNGRVGRFGRKASVASLDEFNAGAFFNEMGVTNSLNPVEGTVAGKPLPAGVDLARDPELDATSLNAADAFVKFLAPPSPLPLCSTGAARRVDRDLAAAFFRVVLRAPARAEAPRPATRRVTGASSFSVDFFLAVMFSVRSPDRGPNPVRRTRIRP